MCVFWQHSSPGAFWSVARMHYTLLRHADATHLTQTSFRLGNYLRCRPKGGTSMTPPHSTSVPFRRSGKPEWRRNFPCVKKTPCPCGRALASCQLFILQPSQSQGWKKKQASFQHHFNRGKERKSQEDVLCSICVCVCVCVILVCINSSISSMTRVCLVSGYVDDEVDDDDSVMPLAVCVCVCVCVWRLRRDMCVCVSECV